MDSFSLKGDDSFIIVTCLEVYDLNETAGHWGHFDISATIEISSRSFTVTSGLDTGTGELYDLYQSLKKCNYELSGTVTYGNYAHELEMSIVYDDLGHVAVKGRYSETGQYSNRLEFEFKTDQTFINNTLQELGGIVNKYGDRRTWPSSA